MKTSDMTLFVFNVFPKNVEINRKVVYNIQLGVESLYFFVSI